MLERIIGVITLRAQTYREIADDQTATQQAITVFIIATLIARFFSGLVQINGIDAATFSLGGGLISAIIGIIIGLIALFFNGWVLATVAKMLGGKTDTMEMVRVAGYVSVFSVVAVINILIFISPALVCLTSLLSLAVGILSLIGYFIGVREAAEFSTTNAIITAVVAAVVNFIIVVLIGGGIATAIIAAFSGAK